MANPRIERFLKLIAAHPDSPLPRFSLANAYFDDGEYARAIEQYELCLKAQPDWAAVLIALGDARANLGDTAGAALALREARQAAFRQGHSSMAQEAIDKLEALGFDD
jgi:predicted Zn-dependent protease